jgi:hypothetical protein
MFPPFQSTDSEADEFSVIWSVLPGMAAESARKAGAIRQTTVAVIATLCGQMEPNLQKFGFTIVVSLYYSASPTNKSLNKHFMCLALDNALHASFNQFDANQLEKLVLI